MNIVEFIEIVAQDGFTRACEKMGITRKQEKEMCEYVLQTTDYKLTPFSTKQQIVYYYIAARLRFEEQQ